MQQFYCKLLFSIFHVISNCLCGEAINVVFVENPELLRSLPVSSRRLHCNHIQHDVRGTFSNVKLNSGRLFSSSPLSAAASHYKRQQPIDFDNISNSDGQEHVLSNATINENTDNNDKQVEEIKEILSCRIVGFYPFPSYTRTGPLAWLFRDTHQAIIVRSSASNERVMMDFMTEGGQNHPVWWDEQVKWNVILGGNIKGEVRVRYTPRMTSVIEPSKINSSSGSKLDRIVETACAYNCAMNIYGNNCRIFCARMEREVTRLNEEDSSSIDRNGMFAGHPHYLPTRKPQVTPPDYAADSLLVWRIICAALLPALYPLFILWACWETISWFP